MPRHDYCCNKCKKVEERFVPLKDLEITQHCECLGILERLFPKIGATHGDEPAWLKTTTEMLKDGARDTIYNNPVTSRGEYNKLMKEKGLEPAA